jgi:RHS repeat-associated protein
VQATDNVSNTSGWAEASVSVVQVTKYYTFGGQRVAMRQGSTVSYLHGDHLGSTSVASVASNGSGALYSRQLYYPYGETRYATGGMPTDFGFTGQRSEGFGLYDYRARFYDPYLARFISADTLVPNPAAPRDFNR